MRNKNMQTPAATKGGTTLISAGTKVTGDIVFSGNLDVEGQVHGGLAQGIAQALYEGAFYDEDGLPLNANLSTYLIPAAPDLPSFITDRTETPSTTHPLGTKGVGEAGTIVDNGGRIVVAGGAVGTATACAVVPGADTAEVKVRTGAIVDDDGGVIVAGSAVRATKKARATSVEAMQWNRFVDSRTLKSTVEPAKSVSYATSSRSEIR